MIPKIIHSIWLSNETKPALYEDCLHSWHINLPDYDIRIWSTSNLPQEVLEHPFVKTAINNKKWAFAADFIRLWALYTFGGIYLDMDVMVYRSFDTFLSHSAFGCIEFNPKNFYKNINKIYKGHILGLNIDAAIIGSEKDHIWIKRIMDYYEGIEFKNSPKFYNKIIMPLVISNVSVDFGFRYVPIYQVLDNDVHIYPPDVFSSCYNIELTRKTNVHDLDENQIRYSCHLCANSWVDKKFRLDYKIKKLILLIIGKQNYDNLKKFFPKKITDSL